MPTRSLRKIGNRDDDNLAAQLSMRCIRCFFVLNFEFPNIVNEANEIQWDFKCLWCGADRKIIRTRILDVNRNIKLNDDDDMVQYARSHESISTHLDDVQCSMIVDCGFVVFVFPNNFAFNSDCVVSKPDISFVRIVP